MFPHVQVSQILTFTVTLVFRRTRIVLHVHTTISFLAPGSPPWHTVSSGILAVEHAKITDTVVLTIRDDSALSLVDAHTRVASIRRAYVYALAPGIRNRRRRGRKGRVWCHRALVLFSTTRRAAGLTSHLSPLGIIDYHRPRGPRRVCRSAYILQVVSAPFTSIPSQSHIDDSCVYTTIRPLFQPSIHLCCLSLPLSPSIHYHHRVGSPPLAALYHFHATYNLVLSPASPTSHPHGSRCLTVIAFKCRRERTSLRRNATFNVHQSPVPFETADVDIVTVNKQTSSLPLRRYVYSAVVVVSAQVPHDGLLVLVKSQLGTLECLNTATVALNVS